MHHIVAVRLQTVVIMILCRYIWHKINVPYISSNNNNLKIKNSS